MIILASMFRQSETHLKKISTLAKYLDCKLQRRFLKKNEDCEDHCKVVEDFRIFPNGNENRKAIGKSNLFLQIVPQLLLK